MAAVGWETAPCSGLMRPQQRAIALAAVEAEEELVRWAQVVTIAGEVAAQAESQQRLRCLEQQAERQDLAEGSCGHNSRRCSGSSRL